MTDLITPGISRRSALLGAGGLGLGGLLGAVGAPGALASSAQGIADLPRNRHLPTSLTTGIKFVSHNDRGRAYTVTYDRVLCDPRNLTKEYPKGFDYRTFSGPKKRLDEVDKEYPYLAFINCDSWANVDGSKDYNNLAKLARPVNVQVMHGKLVQNFDVTYSEWGASSNVRSFVMFKDGTLHHLNNGHQSSATVNAYLRGKIDSNTAFSAGYGDNYVVYGRKSSYAMPANGVHGKSARTILGQRRDGMIVIVTVYGRTGQFGASGPDCAQIMFNEGCYNAMNLDGGGSTQMFWKGRYVHPSSDPAGKRALGGGFLAIKGNLPNPVAAR